MSFTIVTAFLLQKDDSTSSKILDYMNRFEYLKSLNIPTIVYLDQSLKMKESDNLKIIPISLKDTWIFKQSDSFVIPKYRNQEKDTVEYMMIQNSKIEFMVDASVKNPFHTSHFIWIDFGISHVIQNKNNFEKLKHWKPNKDFVIGAVLPNSHNELFNQICWRFAGGIFYGTRETLFEFYRFYQKIIQQNLPKLTWEVNIWALMEQLGFPIDTYYCNHDDSILINL
jgi:hypothetical protein